MRYFLYLTFGWEIFSEIDLLTIYTSQEIEELIVSGSIVELKTIEGVRYDF